MSDEQRKDEEGEVEGHVRSGHMNEEPEVEGHVRSGHLNEEPRDEAETDDDVEAHVRKSNVRHGNVRHD
jgi:hypothetical protein